MSIGDDCKPIETVHLAHGDEKLSVKRYNDGSILLRDPERDDAILLSRDMVERVLAIVGWSYPEATHG